MEKHDAFTGCPAGEEETFVQRQQKQDPMDKFLGSVDYEIACEVLAGVSGHLMNEAIQEEKKEEPDLERIKALDAESTALWQEKTRLKPEDHDAIQRIIYIYGLYSRALLQL